MSEWKLKRFWTSVEVQETEGGFSIALDGRPVKTPAKTSLIVPTFGLAKCIADEWDAQEGEVDPREMPFTRMANAAIDKVSIQKSEVANLLADYADSDLLCYRADGPDPLIEREANVWDPYLEWAAHTLSAQLIAQSGVMHVAQDQDALARLRERTHTLDPFELAAFHDLVSLTGSLVLGFAAIHEFKSADDIWSASRLDEDWQIEQWGADEEAEEVAETKRAAFHHALTFYKALHP